MRQFDKHHFESDDKHTLVLFAAYAIMLLFKGKERQRKKTLSHTATLHEIYSLDNREENECSFDEVLLFGAL